MQTDEIVRRLLSRPVTKARALKVLHLLERPDQMHEVMALLVAQNIDTVNLVHETLTESVVTGHFARRPR